MDEFPRWLYSKDHGSVVVDSATDAALLPDADWFASPTCEGEPYVTRQQESAPAKIDRRTKEYREAQKP